MKKSGNSRLGLITLAIILIISLFLPTISFTEENQEILPEEPEKQISIVEDAKDLLFYRLGRDARYIATSPARLDKSSLFSIALIGSAIGGLMVVDEDIRKYTRSHHNRATNDFFSDYIDPLGDGRYGAAILGLFYLGGTFFDNARARETAIMGIESMACAGALSSLGKLLIGRQRPKRNKGAFDYTGPSSKSYKSSFPSGHTTMAFSLASVIAEQYDNIFIDILSYGAASAVGFQRVYDDNHWVSDVFAGAALGTIIGKTIVMLNKQDSDLKVSPVIDSEKETLGIAFNLGF
ncbi:MAG: phosphatase PAP2 family protein [Candidatus Omnitrophota bacterium]|nr:phosphatase PAP2 family protein [Candidatus Omnitrophota bacterium]